VTLNIVTDKIIATHDFSSRSCKVTDNDAIRQATCDFLIPIRLS